MVVMGSKIFQLLNCIYLLVKDNDYTQKKKLWFKMALVKGLSKFHFSTKL